LTNKNPFLTMSHGETGDTYTTEVSRQCGTGGPSCNSSALSSNHGMARQYRLLGSPTIADRDTLRRRRAAVAAAHPAAAATATAHADIILGSRPTEEEEEERDPR
jgi:hypothetical protein